MKRYLDQLNQLKPQERRIVVGVILAGVIMSGLGIWLVYLARHGQETASVFGQQLNTNTAGIVAIFIGGATIGAGAIVRGMRSKP